MIQTYRPEGAGEQRDRGPRGVLGARGPCAPIGDSGHALPPPLGVVAPHRISRLVMERLALSGSLLAGVTFTPAQPP